MKCPIKIVAQICLNAGVERLFGIDYCVLAATIRTNQALGKHIWKRSVQLVFNARYTVDNISVRFFVFILSAISFGWIVVVLFYWPTCQWRGHFVETFIPFVDLKLLQFFGCYDIKLFVWSLMFTVMMFKRFLCIFDLLWAFAKTMKFVYAFCIPWRNGWERISENKRDIAKTSKNE